MPALPVRSGWGTIKMQEHKGWHGRGYLPHFDSSEVVQMITIRQADSLPAEIWAQWKRELSEEVNAKRELQKRAERYLDEGRGSCLLREDRFASLVIEALLRFDGARHRALSWVVMPNHVHILLEQFPDHLLGEVIGRWKGFTAHEINAARGTNGSFWQEDYFDRFIRNTDHLERARFYIENNPVKAGLCATPEEWPWSSAH